MRQIRARSASAGSDSGWQTGEVETKEFTAAKSLKAPHHAQPNPHHPHHLGNHTKGKPRAETDVNRPKDNQLSRNTLGGRLKALAPPQPAPTGGGLRTRELLRSARIDEWAPSPVARPAGAPRGIPPPEFSRRAPNPSRSARDRGYPRMTPESDMIIGQYRSRRALEHNREAQPARGPPGRHCDRAPADHLFAEPGRPGSPPEHLGGTSGRVRPSTPAASGVIPPTGWGAR